MKLFQTAEQMATNLSRRQFMGQFGRSALAVAAVLGGLLTSTSGAAAARPPRMCAAGSTAPCIGQPEGAYCTVDRYGGVCKSVRNTSVCSCVVRGHPPRGF